MKKDTISRFCTYSLISLASFSAMLGTDTSALTQTANKSLIERPSSSTYIWPTQGIISQGFNKYRHVGIDIAGPEGTPIVAAAPGIVVKAGWDDWGLGNALSIKHPDGSVTVYGHNSRFLVKNGQQISQGQAIAEMGTTGNSSGPHLHFEVHPDGHLPVDPIPVLPSLVAGKIPQQQIATSNISSSVKANNPVSIPISETQSISQSPAIPIATVNSVNTECRGKTVIEGETKNVRVKVCQENGQFFYIGQLKLDSHPVRLPASSVGDSRYEAENGSFSYIVSPLRVEVWRNGRQIRSDSFYSS